MARSREYTIDELAQATALSVRNIRAYRSRGLIRPPRLRGRIGYYDSEHLTQLRLVQALLGRGLSLTVIQRLVERGVAHSELARMARDDLTAPYTGQPVPMSPMVVAALELAQPGVVDQMAALGLGSRSIEGYVGDPALFALANALVAEGVPTPVVGTVCIEAARAAGALVDLAAAEPTLAATATSTAQATAGTDRRALLIELATTSFRTALTTRLPPA
ncbi:MAG TPA: MerR family transcriptional regulator [Actinomycetales bacterium]|jgi:DNA-binding transcriptional MerR regulator